MVDGRRRMDNGKCPALRDQPLAEKLGITRQKPAIISYFFCSSFY